MREMKASEASMRSSERPADFGITNVCESAWLAGLSKTVGTVRIENGSFDASKVVTSHSPLRAKAAVWLPNSATEAW
jgi:hypothetical protein